MFARAPCRTNSVNRNIRCNAVCPGFIVRRPGCVKWLIAGESVDVGDAADRAQPGSDRRAEDVAIAALNLASMT